MSTGINREKISEVKENALDSIIGVLERYGLLVESGDGKEKEGKEQSIFLIMNCGKVTDAYYDEKVADGIVRGRNLKRDLRKNDYYYTLEFLFH